MIDMPDKREAVAAKKDNNSQTATIACLSREFCLSTWLDVFEVYVG